MTNEACDGLECTAFAVVEVEAIVLPCNDPPGISLKIANGEDVVFNQIVTDDLESTTDQGTVNITLDQLDNAIGLKVCAIPFSFSIA